VRTAFATSAVVPVGQSGTPPRGSIDGHPDSPWYDERPAPRPATSTPGDRPAGACWSGGRPARPLLDAGALAGGRPAPRLPCPELAPDHGALNTSWPVAARQEVELLAARPGPTGNALSEARWLAFVARLRSERDRLPRGGGVNRGPAMGGPPDEAGADFALVVNSRFPPPLSAAFRAGGRAAVPYRAGDFPDGRELRRSAVQVACRNVPRGRRSWPFRPAQRWSRASGCWAATPPRPRPSPFHPGTMVPPSKPPSDPPVAAVGLRDQAGSQAVTGSPVTERPPGGDQ